MRHLTLNNSATRIFGHGPIVLPEELTPFQNTKSKRSFPIDPDVVDRLSSINRPLALDARLQKALRSIAQQRQNARLNEADWSPDGLDPRLLPHQRGGVRWLLARRRGILADSQGTGKTVTSLVAAREAGHKRIVIACSNTKREDWARHVREWLGREPTIIEAADEPVGNVIILGVEAARRHAHLRSDVLIVDEAHYLRNRKSQRFKAMSRMAKRSKDLYLLTATPIVNKPQDVWTLLHLVDPIRFGGFWDFIARYFRIEHGHFGVRVRGLRNDQEEQRFWACLREFMIQRDKDYTALPPLVRRVVNHRLEGRHLELYQAMHKQDEATHDGQMIEAVEAVAKVTRLRQLALHPKLLWPSYEGPSKLDTLLKVVQEGDSPMVVFTMFAELAREAAACIEATGRTAEAFTGDDSRASREEKLARLRDGTTQVLVLTHGTGGEGLDLVTADRAVFIDLNWHPAGNEQARDRIYRYGQLAERVEITYIKSVDTIEDHVLAILKKKQPVTAEALARRLEATR